MIQLPFFQPADLHLGRHIVEQKERSVFIEKFVKAGHDKLKTKRLRHTACKRTESGIDRGEAEFSVTRSLSNNR